MRFSLSLGRILYCQYCNGIVRYSSSFSFDPYKILEIPPDATKETIKSAYFKLAKKYHPDRNPSDASAKLKFENVQNAYRYLMEHIAKTSDDPEDKNVPYDFTVSPLGIETHPVPTRRDSKSYRQVWYAILFLGIGSLIFPYIYDFVVSHLPDTRPSLKDEIDSMRQQIRLQRLAKKEQKDISSNLNKTLSMFK